MMIPKPLDTRRARKRLVDRLDDLVGDICKDRDGRRCQWPGCVWSNTVLNCCHFKGRAKMSLRWDLDNVITFCVGHHRYTERNANEFVDFMQKRLGKERYERLLMRNNLYFKTDLSNLTLLHRSLLLTNPERTP